MTVKQKQLILVWFDLLPPKDVDGIWGPQSANATRILQAKLGITIDGCFGMDTEDWALEAMASGRELPDIEMLEKKPAGTFWDEIEDFDRSEFMCTCGGRGCAGFPAEPVEQLVRNLQTTRTHFGRKCIISSGARCKLRNSELPGSAANSLHMRGKAADFCIEGIPASEVLAYIRTLPHVDEAYAIDNSFVHMGVLEYD